MKFASRLLKPADIVRSAMILKDCPYENTNSDQSEAQRINQIYPSDFGNQ